LGCFSLASASPPMLAFASSPLSFSAPALARPAAALRGAASMGLAPPVEKSQALPFAERPAKLDGTLVGDVGFDPLGLSNILPIEWMREAELKHGRVCMLAVVGYIVVDKGLRAPGAEKLVAATSSFTAHDAAVQSGHMWALLLACGLFEIVGAGAIASTLNGGERKPGEFALTGGFDRDAAKLERFKLAEIKHSRLAMMAFSGLVTQDALSHGATGFPYF